MIYNTKRTVIFDPKNPEHRQHFSTFLLEHKWGSCPVNYETRPVVGNKIAVMTAQIAQYYLQQEFYETGMVASKSSV